LIEKTNKKAQAEANKKTVTKKHTFRPKDIKRAAQNIAKTAHTARKISQANAEATQKVIKTGREKTHKIVKKNEELTAKSAKRNSERATKDTKKDAEASLEGHQPKEQGNKTTRERSGRSRGRGCRLRAHILREGSG